MTRRIVLAERWEVLGKLEQGTWADVYAARELDTDTPRAIKRLRSEYARAERVRTRFVAEARAMLRLEHRHVLQVHHVQPDERPWFIMDLAEHGSIKEHIPEGGMEPEDAVRFTLQLLDGLAAAHERGIVHRDVQPANVLLTGEPKEVRVADFGVARLEADHDQLMTMTGESLGSWFYMAPEQRRDPRVADKRSDLYGAGCTLYQLLTHKRPPDLAQHERKPELLQGLPLHLVQVIARATRYKPVDRFASASEMARALRVSD